MVPSLLTGETKSTVPMGVTDFNFRPRLQKGTLHRRVGSSRPDNDSLLLFKISVLYKTVINLLLGVFSFSTTKIKREFNYLCQSLSSKAVIEFLDFNAPNIDLTS